MARITGKNGKVTVASGTVLSIYNWVLNAKVPVVAGTAMGDAFRQQYSLIREWEATAELHWESSGGNTAFWDAFVAATTSGGHQSGKITVEFFPDGAETEKYTGDAFADFSLKAPHDGMVDGSVTLKGTGTLARTP